MNMENNRLYYKFSDYLRERYGQKVYKLPVNIPSTCPNRDGCISGSGCIFCGEEGAGFEILSSELSVYEQIVQNSLYIGKKYGSAKFIAFFQNYSNTYMEYDKFTKYISDACVKDIVAIYISTRPDCINDSYLEFLSFLSKGRNVDIVVELGLQTVNYHTLELLNRGHTLAEFIDAVLRIKRHGLECCAHYILDLPWDDEKDVIEGAKILSALGVDQVKCHSLYILKDTGLGKMYEKGDIKPLKLEDFYERAVSFLEYLDARIVIQRLLGRAPEDRSLFCNFGISWWKIKEGLEEKLKNSGSFQGKKCNYLNGKALTKFRTLI